MEGPDFDLIAMGRCEGKGCYCYANDVLRQVLARLAGAYPWVVLDNEAGLENVSRRLVCEVDWLVLVSDPSQRGLRTAARLHALAAEMEIAHRHLALVVNRLRERDLPAEAQALAARIGADLLLGLPEDPGLAALSERGGALAELPPDAPPALALAPLLEAVAGA